MCATNAIAAMMMAPSNLEAGVIGAMAAITALLVLRARRQVCDWSPSAPFHWERKRAAMAAIALAAHKDWLHRLRVALDDDVPTRSAVLASCFMSCDL